MLATWMVDVYKFSRSAQKARICLASHKNQCFSLVFQCFLFVVLAAERLGKEGTRSKKRGQNNAPKRVTNNKIDQFSNLSNATSKITWQNGLPESPREPPESSRGHPGRPKTVPKSALSAPGPGTAKSTPRAAQSGLGGQLAPTCRFDEAILTSWGTRRSLNSGPRP